LVVGLSTHGHRAGAKITQFGRRTIGHEIAYTREPIYGPGHAVNDVGSTLGVETNLRKIAHVALIIEDHGLCPNAVSTSPDIA